MTFNLPEKFFRNIKSGRFIYISQGSRYNINLINHVSEDHHMARIKAYRVGQSLPQIHDEMHFIDMVNLLGTLGTVAGHHHYFLPKEYWTKFNHEDARWIS